MTTAETKTLPEQIAATVKLLDRLVSKACSPCPDIGAVPLTGADWDSIGISLAKAMYISAMTLADAGYETHGAAELADAIKDELEAPPASPSDPRTQGASNA